MQRRHGRLTRALPVRRCISDRRLGFVTFSCATRTVPTGLANAVWAGSSLVLVVLLGRIFLSETISAAQYVCLGLIITGTLGLYLLGRAPVL